MFYRPGHKRQNNLHRVNRSQKTFSYDKGKNVYSFYNPEFLQFIESVPVCQLLTSSVLNLSLGIWTLSNTRKVKIRRRNKLTFLSILIFYPYSLFSLYVYFGKRTLITLVSNSFIKIGLHKTKQPT